MYAVPPQAIYPELVTLLGSPDRCRAREPLVAAGHHPEALRLTDVVLASDPTNRPALETRLAAVEALFAQTTNINERGWFNGAGRALRAQLAR